jgi:predicted nicotinamide N-methyase
MNLRLLQERLNRTLPEARLEIMDLPDCAPLRLALINADFPVGPLPSGVMQAVIAEPAYWSFCWGSGLAIARRLLADPAAVRGRSVLDLGSGSGVAGIAAASAGARRVIACDTDADARLATRVNAALNGVELEVIGSIEELAGSVDLVLLADVLYDRGNLGLVDLALQAGSRILVADSRIHDLSHLNLQEIGRMEAHTLPNLGEFDAFRVVRFFSRRGHGHPIGAL